MLLISLVELSGCLTTNQEVAGSIFDTSTTLQGLEWVHPASLGQLDRYLTEK